MTLPIVRVVFVQYDRRKYALALERLVGLLTRLQRFDFEILVVDNAHPGDWQHDVSAKMTQIGGDNSAWEFSAFDRGVAFLADRQPATSLYVFATDAFLAYGAEYLELIDDETLAACVDLQAAVGWVDSFGHRLELLGHSYRDWARTSLLLLPSATVSTFSPLATPFASAAIFGTSCEAPFLPSAPLSQQLRQRLLAWLTRQPTEVALEEVWHSQIDLDDTTLPFFTAKASAILREHLLSARLQAAGVPCYDFRLIRRLIDNSRRAGDMTSEERGRWQWTAGIDAQVTPPPRFHIETFDAPKVSVHGLPSSLRISGWVKTTPQVREAALRFSGGLILGIRCDIPRPDVRSSISDSRHLACGFELETDLGDLPPGNHRAEWYVPGTDLLKELGTIHIVEQFQFDPERLFLPAAAYPGSRLPIAFDGLLLCSQPLRSVAVYWDGVETSLETVFVAAPAQPNGMRSYRVSSSGEIPYRRKKPQHTFEVRFESIEGLVSSWRQFHVLQNEAVLPHSISIRTLSDFDSRDGSVEIRLRGAVLSDSSKDSVVLLCEGRTVAQGTLEDPDREQPAIHWFDIQTVSHDLSPGLWRFSLALQRPDSTAPEIFARWQNRIDKTQPTFHTETIAARLLQDPPGSHLLQLSGWVENHLFVDHIDVLLDEKKVASVTCNELRKDVAEHFGQPLIQRQGFRDEIRLEAEPGDHTLSLVAIQADRASARCDEKVTFPKPRTASFAIESEVLDALTRTTEHDFWGSITIRGTAFTALTDCIGRLFVAGELADEQPLASGVPFELRFIPKRSGTYPIRALFSSGEQTLYDSFHKEAVFDSLALPDELITGLDRFVERFNIRQALGIAATTKQIGRRLVVRRGKDFPVFLDVWRKISGALSTEAAETPEPLTVSEDELANWEAPAESSLEVLFVSWEVPCSRHGGGVWMMNLLSLLAERHKITVVHSYGLGEESWADELRPLVSKVISVPRHSGTYDGDTKIPGHLYADYSAELRLAVERELLTGRYDIVDYEYSRMYTHMSNEEDTPRLLTIFEEGFAAKLLACSETRGNDVERSDHLHDLLEEFYFRAHVLPRAFRHFIAVTEEDAKSIHSFLGDAKVFVNTIGVDVEKFARPREFSAPEDMPSNAFVFLGNYRHPPNVEAAVFFAEKVMPGLRTARPEAEFLVLGAHPNQQVQDLAELEGV
ncbi:MAG: hypothetical protein AAF657_01400, partial [Acidobacteriota bacterium]